MRPRLSPDFSSYVLINEVIEALEVKRTVTVIIVDSRTVLEYLVRPDTTPQQNLSNFGKRRRKKRNTSIK